MALPMLALATVASAIQQKRAEKDARKQAAVDIMKQQAASMGAPSYGVQAAQFNKDMAEQPTLTDKLLQGYAAPKIKGMVGGGQPEPDEDDLLGGL